MDTNGPFSSMFPVGGKVLEEPVKIIHGIHNMDIR